MAHKQPDFRQNPSPPSRGTDEVIGRFQSASSDAAVPQEAPVRERPEGEAHGGGLGRFFRAASERLHPGRSGSRRQAGTFERERSFDDMDERALRPSASYDAARETPRHDSPEAAYGDGLREDRGLYSDFGGRSEERSHRQGRELPRAGWQREPLTAQDIMTRSPRSVRRDTALRDAAQIMKDENVGIVPVVDEGGRLVGVLTDRDIVVRAFVDERSPAGLRVAEVMTDDVEAVTPEESLHEVIELMGRKQVRRVPVVARDDRLLGIIAMADIANRAEQDEELQTALARISARRSFWSRL